jgi:hypothetical protein
MRIFFRLSLRCVDGFPMKQELVPIKVFRDGPQWKSSPVDLWVGHHNRRHRLSMHHRSLKSFTFFTQQSKPKSHSHSPIFLFSSSHGTTRNNVYTEATRGLLSRMPHNDIVQVCTSPLIDKHPVIECSLLYFALKVADAFLDMQHDNWCVAVRCQEE